MRTIHVHVSVDEHRTTIIINCRVSRQMHAYSVVRKNVETVPLAALGHMLSERDGLLPAKHHVMAYRLTHDRAKVCRTAAIGHFHSSAVLDIAFLVQCLVFFFVFGQYSHHPLF